MALGRGFRFGRGFGAGPSKQAVIRGPAAGLGVGVGVRVRICRWSKGAAIEGGDDLEGEIERGDEVGD